MLDDSLLSIQVVLGAPPNPQQEAECYVMPGMVPGQVPGMHPNLWTIFLVQDEILLLLFSFPKSQGHKGY